MAAILMQTDHYRAFLKAIALVLSEDEPYTPFREPHSRRPPQHDDRAIESPPEQQQQQQHGAASSMTHQHVPEAEGGDLGGIPPEVYVASAMLLSISIYTVAQLIRSSASLRRA